MALGAAFALAGTQAIGFISSRLAVWYFVAVVVLLAMAAVNLRLWRPRLPAVAPRMRAAGTSGGVFMVGVPFGLMACPGCTPLLLPVALGAATAGNVFYGAALMGRSPSVGASRSPSSGLSPASLSGCSRPPVWSGADAGDPGRARHGWKVGRDRPKQPPARSRRSRHRRPEQM